MAERVKSILLLRGSTEKMDASHVSQISILMDPVGPLRYKGLVTMPNAMGPDLADAFLKKDKERIKLIVEFITSGTAVK